jgi:hypothetical protein
VPLFDQVRLYGDDVAKVLAADGHLLALGDCHAPLNDDESHSGLEDHELSPLEQRFLREQGRRLPKSDNLFQGIDWTGVHVNPDRIRRALSGSSGSGSPDSIAGRMWRAIKSSRRGIAEWAVTDQRLLVLTGDTAVHKTYTVVFSVPPFQIKSATGRGKLLFHWGRVEIIVTDDSMLAFNAALLDIVAALLGIVAACQLVAALSDP